MKPIGTYRILLGLGIHGNCPFYDCRNEYLEIPKKEFFQIEILSHGGWAWINIDKKDITPTPVIELTEQEFEALPNHVRFLYESHEEGANPSHSNYYLCCLIMAVQEGKNVPKRVWDSLNQSYKDHLQWIQKCRSKITKTL